MPMIETDGEHSALNKPLDVPLTPKRRELMLTVMDGVSDLGGAMHCLHHYKYCDEILSWLIWHRYVGKNLSELIVKKFNSSIPDLVSYVIRNANAAINAEKIKALPNLSGNQ